MDTHTSQISTDSLGRRGGPRRRWPEETKRRIVEETFKPGASVAIVARRYELNANVVFAWRRLYRADGIGASTDGSADLIPVKVIAPDTARKDVPPQACAPQTDSIEVLLAGGTQVRFSGSLAREAFARNHCGGVCAMIVPSGTRIWLVAGATDRRRYAAKTVMRRVRRRARICSAAGPISTLHNGRS